MFERFALDAEFSLDDFVITDRIQFNYTQAFLDSDDGTFVPFNKVDEHQHVEELDGRTYLDEESGEYNFELFPYAFESHLNLLTAISMMCRQVQSLENSEELLQGPTTQMELESVQYVWAHRQALCAVGDEQLEHHIDFLERALHYRALAED